MPHHLISHVITWDLSNSKLNKNCYIYTTDQFVATSLISANKVTKSVSGKTIEKYSSAKPCCIVVGLASVLRCICSISCIYRDSQCIKMPKPPLHEHYSENCHTRLYKINTLFRSVSVSTK